MEKRKLGISGLEVSAIGMGCINLSFGTGKAVEVDKGVKVIRSGVDVEHWHGAAKDSS